MICLIAFGVSPMTEGAGNRPVLVPRMPMAPARIPGAEAAWVLRGVTALTRPSASSTEPPLAFVLRSGVGGEGEGDTTSGGSPTVVVMRQLPYRLTSHSCSLVLSLFAVTDCS